MGLFFVPFRIMEIDVTVPRPHDKQLDILNSQCKRRVVCAGRRGGKTTMLAFYSVQKFLEGERVIYGTPVAKQLKDYWGLVKKYLKPLIRQGYIYKNETDKYLRWSHDDDDGAMISAQTAYDANTWRGGHGSILIYDEYAFMHPSVWDVVGVPMLLDTGGEAWFISTPNRKNHFHNLYMRGLDSEDGRWQSFKFTSYDNPHLDPTELKHMIEDMTEDNHKQEILAEFLENEGAVFRNVAQAHTAPSTRPHDHIDHMLVAGIDWGKRQDYTVISIICCDCKTEVLLTRFNKIDYTYQRQRLMDDLRLWNVQNGLAELNAMGEPNLELLQFGSQYENAHVLMVRDKNNGYVMVFNEDREFDPKKDFYGPFVDIENVQPPHVPYAPETCRYGQVVEWDGMPAGYQLKQLWEEGERAPGLPISGFWTTAQSKPPLIENLVRVVGKQEYTYLPHPIAQAEMESYEVKINPQTNRPIYSAPDGVNDDTVIARALATWQASRHLPALI